MNSPTKRPRSERTFQKLLLGVTLAPTGVIVPAPWPAAPSALAADAPAPVELTVYAAASLKDALSELGPACGKEAGATLVYNFGASNDLARQIVAANKADVFFSADEARMDEVAAKGLVDASSRRTLLSNRLVVVVPSDATIAIGSAADLASDRVKRLSLANPDAVPAGKYARAWLDKMGMWEKTKEKVVPAPDVRAALAAVEAGAVEAGIVYRTDAAIARKAKVVYTIPDREGPKIAYPVAALRDRPDLEASRRVVACLAGGASRAVFEKHGFLVLDAVPAAAPR